MKGLVVGTLALVIAASAAHGRERSPVWVIDGDTIDIRGTRVRVANLDAPDIGSHAKCAGEERLGQEAKRYAIQLIRGAKRVEIVNPERLDRYGRTVAHVSIDGRDFGDTMLRAGQARPWRGRSSDWCSGS